MTEYFRDLGMFGLRAVTESRLVRIRSVFSLAARSIALVNRSRSRMIH